MLLSKGTELGVTTRNGGKHVEPEGWEFTVRTLADTLEVGGPPKVMGRFLNRYKET